MDKISATSRGALLHLLRISTRAIYLRERSFSKSQPRTYSHSIQTANKIESHAYTIIVRWWPFGLKRRESWHSNRLRGGADGRENDLSREKQCCRRMQASRRSTNTPPPPPHTHTTFVPFLWRRRKLASQHGEKGEVAIKNKRSRGIFMGRAMKPSSHADLQVEVNDTDREGGKRERERKKDRFSRCQTSSRRPA